MSIHVVILRDIRLQGWTEPFTKKCSAIEYDTKSATQSKLHRLTYQQGEQYGTIGDCCTYLTQPELEALAAAGYVKIVRRKSRRAVI